jgi:hypothetical protein
VSFLLPAMYLLFSFIVWKDVRLFCLLMFTLMLVDAFSLIQAFPAFYYWVATTDVLTILFSFTLSNHTRRNVIIGLSLLNFGVNINEALSVYQTIIYPYYDTIQFIITEGILLTTIYKAARFNIKRGRKDNGE